MKACWTGRESHRGCCGSANRESSSILFGFFIGLHGLVFPRSLTRMRIVPSAIVSKSNSASESYVESEFRDSFDSLPECWRSLPSLDESDDDALKLLSELGSSSGTFVKWISSASGVESLDLSSECREVPESSDESESEESRIIVTSSST